MPITDYKITDIERDAVSVEKQRPDVMDPDADITKAWFDTYPDKIRAEHDSLIDYLATAPISYLSSAAAATANKGSITGFVPLGAIIELSMTNGNTAVSPTVTIDGVSHAITGMPTTAQVQANSTQTYRLVKTGATALTFTKNPDYICEYGTNSDGFPYTVYASGRYDYGLTFTPVVTAQAGAITTYTATCSYIKVGRKVTAIVSITITNIGTASGYIKFTLPLIVRGFTSCSGVNGSNTNTLTTLLQSNDTYARAWKYDGSASIISGNEYFFTLNYITD